MTKSSLPLVALAAALAGPASAQYAPAPANDADQLAAEMRVIGANPTDVVALTEAGELSTRLGDLSGAASLFARADKVDPRNGRVKAGMAGVLLHFERPGEALRFYDQAEGYGYPVARFAADRGLAYDLVAQQGRAQRDYRLALAGGAADDETVRRYALSLGISGQKEAALHLLDPLLRRNDRAGWRARAFVLAMNGETGAAQTIATTMMAPGQASGMAAFFARLPSLSPADRAFAVQFGELRPTPQRLADLRLAPALPTLAAEIVPVARAAPPVQVAVTRVDKRKRGKKGAVQLAALTLPPVAPPLPAPPAYGSRTLASGPARAVPGFGAGAPATRSPVAVSTLSARTLPPAYGAASQLNRSPAVVAALAPRVLPARSPLPPPPVLARPQAFAMPAQVIAVSGPGVATAIPAPRQPALAQVLPPSTSTLPVAGLSHAPVALAQSGAARADRYVAIERPGSLLQSYVRVPSSARPPTGTGTSPAFAPQVARVTGTLGAPTPTEAVSPPVPGLVVSAAVPGSVVALGPISSLSQASVISESPRVAAAQVNPSVTTLPRDAGTGVAVGTVASFRPAPSSSIARAAGSADVVPQAAGVSPPSAALARASAAPPSSSGVLSPAAAANAAGLTGPGTPVASPVTARASGVVGPVATFTKAAPTVDLPTAAVAPPGGLVGPSLDTGGAPAAVMTSASPLAVPVKGTAAPDVTPAGVSSASGPGNLPADPIASGEPAGVAVTRALPASDGVLARIVAALPVPASELNIAPAAAVPKHVQPASPVAATAGDGIAPLHAGSGQRDSADFAYASSRSGRHAPLVASDSASLRKHLAGADEDAPDAKPKTRKATAVAEDTAPRSRKRASDTDTPATGKGRHAALAKADEDEALPVHGKRGRHDNDDDQPASKHSTGKKALAAQHQAEPQKYWVQVAGGANGASLGKAWQIAQGKAPALAGRKGYTTPLHATNRVLAGPFKSDDEARAFVNTLNKQGVHAFQFTNDKGQKVKKLDDE